MNDYRWKKDIYTGITLKMEERSNQGHDWEFFKAKKFFDRKRHHDILLSYAKGDGNLLDLENIRYFIRKDL